MKIAVCDDEKLFRGEMKEALARFFGGLELVCAEFESGEELVAACAGGEAFDAVFLDIEMPGTDGMTAAEQLRKSGFAGPIIFLTSHTELAMEGYEVAAFRFLAKPVNPDKLERTLCDLNRELMEKKRLMIRCEGEETVLLLEEICYVEARNNSVRIVTTGGEYTVRKKLSDLEKELAALTDCFVRIHRGYLVNLAHVKKYHGSEVFLTGETALPVSRGMANEFKRSLFSYVKSSAR